MRRIAPRLRSNEKEQMTQDVNAMSKNQYRVIDSLEQKPEESDADHIKRVMAFITGDDVRSKTDLGGWTGSMPFHLDQAADTK